MAWTVMWSGGPRSTAAIVEAVMEGKYVVAYNLCPMGDVGHLQHIEKAWRWLSKYVEPIGDFIIPKYIELSDNYYRHGRNDDLVALMTYPAHIFARDYTTQGHEGIIYGKKIESIVRDRLNAKGYVRYGPDIDDVPDLLEEIGLTMEDLL